MKRLTAILILISAFSSHFSFAQWVPISVNTNTWACKPYGATFTNYWNDLASGTALTVVSNLIGTTTTSETSSPPISVQSPYNTAILWWDFYADNGTGTNITDASGNGEHGYEVSDLTLTYNQPEWADYAGDVSYIKKNGWKTETPDMLYLAAEYSIAFWLQRKTTDRTPEYDYIIGAGAFYGCGLGDYGAGLRWADGVATNISMTEPTVGEWVHFTATRRANDVFEVWTNAVKVGSVAATLGYPDADLGWSIGGNMLVNNYVDCLYDDVAMWGRVLTGSEITNMYNNGRSTNATWYSSSSW